MEVKRIKIDTTPFLAIDACSKQINELKQSVNHRMANIENKLTAISSNTSSVTMRLESLDALIKASLSANAASSCNSTHRHSCCDEVLQYLKTFKQEMFNSLGCPQTSPIEAISAPPVVIVHNQCPPNTVSANVSLDSKVQVITLNTESDYPEGSWLGDESNPECRVRVPIAALDLLHINSFCHSPEKTALMLLDYLFPREVLAVSNLSGKGRHGKKQLSPLMIYGIRCHLVHRFNISERDWYRIKQNMDSKCRTAWRKKLKGLPLGGFKHTVENEDLDEDDSGNPLHSVIVTSAAHMHSDDSVDEMDQSVQLIHTDSGDIKVLQATQARLNRIQESHSIRVLNEDQLLPAVLHENASILGNDPPSDLVVTENDHLHHLSEHQTLLVTSSGEVLSLSSAAGINLSEEFRTKEEDENN